MKRILPLLLVFYVIVGHYLDKDHALHARYDTEQEAIVGWNDHLVNGWVLVSIDKIDDERGTVEKFTVKKAECVGERLEPILPTKKPAIPLQPPWEHEIFNAPGNIYISTQSYSPRISY